MGLKAPMVIRFQDLLRHRVIQLNEVFRKAIKEEGYKGTYRGVFPIKVNQLREVVEEILAAGKDYNYGLEAGSKPELMIALAMHEGANRLIICNGYKDDDYIRLALLGRKLGKQVILVVEQLSELDDIIRLSAETGVKPMIGFRAKLQTRGEGRWALSTGRQRQVRPQHRGDPVRLRKAARLAKLDPVPAAGPLPHRLPGAEHHHDQERGHRGHPLLLPARQDGLPHGLPRRRRRPRHRLRRLPHQLRELDELLAGGVRARRRLQRPRDLPRRRACPSPTSSASRGRAVVAPHSMLVVEVFERINKRESLGQQHQPKEKHKVVTDLEVLLKNKAKLGRLERFHDALQKKEEALSLFNLGYLDLENRAAAESIFWQICEQIAEEGPASRLPARGAARPARSSSPTSTSATSPSSSRSSTTGRSSSSSPSPRSTGSTSSPPSTPSSSTSPATPTARSAASSTCRTSRTTSRCTRSTASPTTSASSSPAPTRTSWATCTTSSAG